MAEEPLFDSRADTYDSWYTTPLGAYIDELEKNLVFRHLGIVRGKTALDAGCGTGLYSIRLAELGADVTAVDVSPKMLEVARRKAHDRGQYVWFDEADMTKLPYENRTFDIVLSVTALEFTQEPLAAIMEMARVLRPGGKLVVGVLNGDSPWINARREQEPRDESVYGSAHFFSPAELRRLFHQSGTFGALTMESCVYIPTEEGEVDERFAARQELLGRLLRPLTGAFLVGTARQR